MIPKVLDFRITSKCNLSCPFCFGPTVQECLDEITLGKFFEFMKKYGVEYIVLTGGEPTLSPFFKRIIEMLHSLNFYIALSTNGTFWNNEELRILVLKYCSWIALPVESVSSCEHNRMRCYKSDHYALIRSILPKIRETAPHIKIKIGTVVTRENYKNVPLILDSLPILPDVWKLFQLSISEINQEYYAKQHIPNDMFSELINQIKQQYKGGTTKIHASYEKDRNGRYLFVEPNGTIMTIKDNAEYVIGDYRDCSDALIDQIERNIESFNVNSNFYNSFALSSGAVQK